MGKTETTNAGREPTEKKAVATAAKDGTIKPLKPKVNLSKLKPLESAYDFMQRDIPPLTHVLDGIITEGVGLLAAKEKSGKSWFCYQLGDCVACGKPFLGRNTKQGTVLYFDLENDEPVRKDRLATMFPSGYSRNLFFISPPEEDPDSEEDPDDPWIIGQGFEDVLNFYLDQKPDTALVIVDVLDTVADDPRRNEAPKKHAYRNIRRLKRIARKRHIAIVCITHFRKNIDPDDFLSNISGSNGWAAAADFAMGISRKRGESEAVFQTDGRTAKSVEMEIVQDEKTMKWRQEGSLEEMRARKRLEEFEQNEITAAVVRVVKANKGSWTGTSDVLKAETIFDHDGRLAQTPNAITRHLQNYTDLFKKVYGLSVINKNANNSKGAEWVIKVCM